MAQVEGGGWGKAGQEGGRWSSPSSSYDPQGERKVALPEILLHFRSLLPARNVVEAVWQRVGRAMAAALPRGGPCLSDYGVVRRVLQTTCLLLLLLASAGVAAGGGRSGRRNNIVLILTDDQDLEIGGMVSRTDWGREGGGAAGVEATMQQAAF